MSQFNKYALFVGILMMVTSLTFSSLSVYSDSNDLADEVSESVELDREAFDLMMDVLTHKRCVNCHPSGDAPRQGEDSHLHNFGIVRGEDNHGLVGYTCNTCHQDENNDFSGVPGAPHWAVAPIEMAWEGKSRVEIARQMMDPKRNGGRTAEEIMEHLTEHELVLWAWDPGIDAAGNSREKPPVPKDEYIAAVKEWIENGAIIPEE